MKKLEDIIASGASADEVAAMKAEIKAAQAKAKNLGSRRGFRRGGKGKKAPVKKTTTCAPGDPLCSDI